MRFNGFGLKSAIISIVIGLLICGGIVVFGIHKKSNSITYDKEHMIEYANKFYAQGDIKKAVKQLEYYCLDRDDVYDEEMQLAQWYTELGDEEKALKSYDEAVRMADYDDNDISVNNPFYHVSSDSVEFTIEPVVGFTRNVELVFKGENITSETYDIGKVNGIRDELTDDQGCRTTQWVEVDKSKGSVILTGDINCAIWQFMNASGEITNIEDLYIERDEEGEPLYPDDKGENVLCRMGSIEMRNRAYSVMEIPEDAVKCRVTYADESIGDRKFSDSRGIVMYYGSILQGYSDSGASACKLPDLSNGQSISYKDGKWELYVNGSYMQDLDIDAPAIYNGAGIFMQGDICGRVTVNPGSRDIPGDPDAEYGIEFSPVNGISVCRRLGDAVGMHFDYRIDDKWAGGGTNDFDSAYPWSEMKLCCLSYDENGALNIAYEGDPGFATDGSGGNVMVEIPKFYVKRVQNEETEQIWVSGVMHNGYVPDPVFLDGGEEKDHVYVGAYLGADEDGILRSRSGVYPSVNISYENIRNMANQNGMGFREIGFTMYSAIQKLFMVETGCLDSTSVMAGEQDLYYYTQNKDYNNRNTGIAIQSMAGSNRIVVNSFWATDKLEEGSSIVLLNTTDGWSALEKSGGPNGAAKPEDAQTDEGEENGIIEGGCCREMISISSDDEHIEITFDGEPVDIRAGETVVASYPSLTGKTSAIDYCTGCLVANNGRHGFKYRNIENIYGSEMVMLGSDAYIMDGSFWFIDDQGEEQVLNDFIPEQNMGIDGGETDHNNTNDICIKKMSYDENYPTFMVPVEYGASTYSNYADYYYYKSSTDGNKYYLCAGDIMSSKRAGGLFQFRAMIDSDEFARYYCGGRLMFR